MTKDEILDWDHGLTYQQLIVLLEEVEYQNNIQLAAMLDKETVSLPALATIIGAMFGGGSNIADAIESIGEVSRKLKDEQFAQETKEQKRLSDEELNRQLEHPLFAKFRDGKRGSLG